VKTNSRHDHIVSLIDEHSFLTVSQLSELCGVSEMTIRRDLEQLHAKKRIQRTYGGAVSLRNGTGELEEISAGPQDQRVEVLLVDQVDVLIATSVNPYLDRLLIDRAIKKGIPIIAESIEMSNERTVVAVDNYCAGFDLGFWAGKYLQEQGIKKANLST
jgi:predicted transcriptional regulator